MALKSMNHWILILGWLVAAIGIAYNWRQMLLALSESGREQSSRIAFGSRALFQREYFSDSGWRHRNFAFVFAVFWIMLGMVWIVLSVRA